MATLLSIRELTKSFAGTPVLAGVSLDVEEGEILVLLGPSGSGKTTLLRAIAGFERPDAGHLILEGEEIEDLPPARREFGMVFQHFALFPHLSVGRNVAFGLETRGLRPEARDERVREMLALVDLAGFEDRRVDEISGGQQQRVAVARALAPRPRLLLLDEPLSNLDPELRERTRRELRSAIRRVGISAVWVTHEQQEAFDVGDRVAVLHQGRLDQIGPSEELYLEPRTPFVARFVGRASFLPAIWEGEGRAAVGDDRFVGCGAHWRAAAVGQIAIGARVDLLLRPEALRLVPAENEGSLAGTVLERRYAGETTFYRVAVDVGGEVVVADAVRASHEGQKVGIAPNDEGPAPRAFPGQVAEEVATESPTPAAGDGEEEE
jgi:ABC-type Fe3+/spermidine/putrescine transport system ATPase subunit